MANPVKHSGGKKPKIKKSKFSIVYSVFNTTERYRDSMDNNSFSYRNVARESWCIAYKGKNIHDMVFGSKHEANQYIKTHLNEDWIERQAVKKIKEIHKLIKVHQKEVEQIENVANRNIKKLRAFLLK